MEGGFSTDGTEGVMGVVQVAWRAAGSDGPWGAVGEASLTGHLLLTSCSAAGSYQTAGDPCIRVSVASSGALSKV